MTIEGLQEALRMVELDEHWKFEDFEANPCLETLPKFGLSQTQMDYMILCVGLTFGPEAMSQFRPQGKAPYQDISVAARQVELYADSVYSKALAQLRPEIEGVSK